MIYYFSNLKNILELIINFIIKIMTDKTKEFIDKAIKKHGNKYDYSKVEYIKSSEKVIIICKEHDEFKQSPNQHLIGHGCKKCGIEKNYNNTKSNNEDFIKKAMEIHNNKYEYSKVEYIKSSEKVIIICKIHGEFEQIPSGHLRGYGCKKCGIEKNLKNNLIILQQNAKIIGDKYRKTKEQFIEEAIKIHSNKYDYSKIQYLNINTKIIINCKKHGDFEQIASGHLRGYGCKKCGIESSINNRKSNTEEFINKCIIVHKDKYDYSKVKYINSKSKIIIICKEHGEFEQTPLKHLSGSGCNKCGIEKNANNKRSNNDEFIKKSIEIHQDKYDYSKINYKNNCTKVIIICKEHEDFEQIPNSHLLGIGCKKCAIKKNANNTRSNNDEFIKKAFVIHNNKYDYSKVEYKNALEKVIIICKIHGEFYQKPSVHLDNHGCNICGGRNKKTTEEFIEKAIKIHNNKYDYSNINYINCKSKVTIICKEHGNFEQIANDHLNGFGCSFCSGCNKKTKEEFIEKATEIHNNKYDYSKVDYINCKSEIIILCKEHGEFKQIPQSHLIGQGCRKCANLLIGLSKRKTLDDFIERANIIHANKYDYSNINYIDLQIKINIICKEHGNFAIKPTKHIHSYQGCPRCQNIKQYSKIQIKWLNFIEKYYNIDIQHAENNGEYLVPSKKYKADGYCKETNTIYEFHGDYWHGNPKLFKSLEYNKTTNCTFGDLYQKTLEREQQIKDLCYNLVVMWEYDWNIINKSIKKLQQKFRNSKLLV